MTANIHCTARNHSPQPRLSTKRLAWSSSAETFIVVAWRSGMPAGGFAMHDQFYGRCGAYFIGLGAFVRILALCANRWPSCGVKP